MLVEMIKDIFRRPVLFQCGHSFEPGTEVLVYGHPCRPILNRLSREHCPMCLANMATRCWNCGKTIFPGEMVTLYVVEDPSASSIARVPLADMKFHKGSPVGCTRCAEMGVADACAYWVKPGKVDISQNPISDMAS